MTRIVKPLRPPFVEIDPDIRWVLLAAFADVYSENSRPASARRASKLIETFSLLNQVLSRLSHAQLAQALTKEFCERLQQSFRNRIMRSLAVTQTQALVCSVAEEASVNIALLKQAALEVLKLASPQQRYATDVDVLIRPKDLPLFTSALERRGLSLEKGKRHAHGVPVLRSTSGIGVELHVSLFDLHLGSSHGPVTFDSLHERALLLPIDSKRNHVLLPALEAVAAHLIAQGWYLFHYVPNAPSHKSPFRILADLRLLGLSGNEHLSTGAFALLQHELPEDEFFGLVTLAGHLARGNLDNLAGLPQQLLHHAIASKLDASYRRRLVIPRQIAAIRSEGMLAYTGRQVGRIWRRRNKVCV